MALLVSQMAPKLIL